MFTDKQKNIFKYFDGSADVYADPLRVHRVLVHELDGEPNKFLERIQEGSEAPEPLKYEAMERVLAAARVAFAIPAFNPADGTGGTEEDVLTTLCQFQAFEAQKKTLAETTHTWPAPTEAASPATTTASGMDTGLIATK